MVKTLSSDDEKLSKISKIDSKLAVSKRSQPKPDSAMQRVKKLRSQINQVQQQQKDQEESLNLILEKLTILTDLKKRKRTE